MTTSAMASPDPTKTARSSSVVVIGGRLPTYKRFENSISVAPTGAATLAYPSRLQRE